MLHCTSLSVHCGRGGKIGGGVMEDGRLVTPRAPHGTPHHQQHTYPTPRLADDQQKTHSLPGFYSKAMVGSNNKSNHNQPSTHTFKDAFTASYSPFSKRRAQDPNPPSKNQKVIKGEEKKKGFLGGLFRSRRRKENSSSNSSISSESSSEDGQQKKRFFHKKGKKNERSSHGMKELSKSFHPRNELETGTINSPYSQQTSSLPRDSRNIIRNSNPALEPFINGQKGNLRNSGVSLSYDSLPVSQRSFNSESAYGSINSASVRSSASNIGTNLNLSTESLSKKEKREALKARVERLRERTKPQSSSDDEGESVSSQFGSLNSLNTGSLGSRSNICRTERYIRRKSQELETLKIEKEKDRRNREAVQARILEIQKIQKRRTELRNKLNQSKENTSPGSQHKWSANVVYQESSEFDAVTIQNPNKNNHQNQRIAMPEKLVPMQHQYHSHGNRITSPYIPSRRSFQEDDQSFGNINKHRSLSYESNLNQINKATSDNISRLNNNLNRNINKFGNTAPIPPPRDKTRVLSPIEHHRPMSYSFESLSRDSANPSLYSPFNVNNTHKPSHLAVGSLPNYAKTVPMDQPRQLPVITSSHRSYSEKQLFPSKIDYSKNCGPSRPLLPKPYFVQSNVDPSQENIPKHFADVIIPDSSQGQHGQGQQYNKSSHNKVVLVANIPPSPSSDYSSYVSDTQQVSHPMKPKTDVKSCIKKSPVLNNSSSSRSNSPKIERTRQTKVTSYPLATSTNGTGQRDITTRYQDSDSSRSSERNLDNKARQKVKTGQKVKPEPPVRNSSSLTKKSRLLFRKHIESMLESEDNSKKIGLERLKKFEEVYKREKERLEKSKCANFEEALLELEDIYQSLNLNSEDIMTGAERKDNPSLYQSRVLDEYSSIENDNKISVDEHDESLNSQPSKDTSQPPSRKNDLHYRRCKQNNKGKPDAKKSLQIKGSYLLVSPAHLQLSDLDETIQLQQEKPDDSEPDIIKDDVNLRNFQRANAIKVIDPQPAFGIPIGPVTQCTTSNYLDFEPTPPVTQPTTRRSREPDVVVDDLAFRSLRKDGKNASNKSLENTEDLDDLDSPMSSARVSRSASADRVVRSLPHPLVQKVDNKTPRKVKSQNKSKRSGKFFDTYREALTDNEANYGLKNNPSWVERANLTDSEWGALNLCKEDLENRNSVEFTSKNDIRHAIIKESRESHGGPTDENPFKQMEFADTATMEATHTIKRPDPPALVKVNAILNAPSNPIIVDKKSCHTIDAIYNQKPKPFYLTQPDPSISPSVTDEKTDRGSADIGKLDDLIFALQNLDTCDAKCGKDESNLPTNERTISRKNSITAAEILSEARKTLEVDNCGRIKESECAKTNIQNVILSSMANSNEGKDGNFCSNIESSRRKSYPYSFSSVDVNVKNTILPQSHLAERVLMHEDMVDSRRNSVSHDALAQDECNSSVAPITDGELIDIPACDWQYQSPYVAARCRNTVKTMLVESESLSNRIRRAKSVPTSPKSSGYRPVSFDPSLKVIPKAAENGPIYPSSFYKYYTQNQIKTDQNTNIGKDLPSLSSNPSLIDQITNETKPESSPTSQNRHSLHSLPTSHPTSLPTSRTTHNNSTSDVISRCASLPPSLKKTKRKYSKGKSSYPKGETSFTLSSSFSSSVPLNVTSQPSRG